MYFPCIITSLPIDKKEIKEVLQKYKLNKKYHRLKDGSFINLENNKDIEFLSTLVEGLDIPYKNIEGKFELPVNRALYLDKLLKQNSQISVESDENFNKIIQDTNIENDNNNLPEKLEKILRDYQKVGYSWLTILDKAALRADPVRSRQILERIPAGRWGEAADIAGACVFLCSPAAAYVHGAILPVDGGWLAR